MDGVGRAVGGPRIVWLDGGPCLGASLESEAGKVAARAVERESAGEKSGKRAGSKRAGSGLHILLSFALLEFLRQHFDDLRNVGPIDQPREGRANR